MLTENLQGQVCRQPQGTVPITLSTLILCVQRYRKTGFFGKIRFFEITDSEMTEHWDVNQYQKCQYEQSFFRDLEIADVPVLRSDVSVFRFQCLFPDT